MIPCPGHPSRQGFPRTRSTRIGTAFHALTPATTHRSAPRERQIVAGRLTYAGLGPAAAWRQFVMTFVVRTRRREFQDSSLMRTPARSRAELESSRVRVPCTARMGIVPGDTAAYGCARQISDPLPTCLRPLSIERRNTVFVCRGRCPLRHAPPSAKADSGSPRPANTDTATVGSIRSVTARDLHHTRLPSPCTEYHRPLADQRAALGFRAAPAT